MKLVPFKGSIAIRPEKSEKKSKSGLEYEFASDSNGVGEIIGVPEKSEKFTMADVGKRVLFVKNQVTRVLLDGEEYFVPLEDDVLCEVTE